MKDSLTKSKEDGKQSISNDSVNEQPITAGLEDNSPEAISMRDFQSKVDGGEEMQELGNYQDKIGDSEKEEAEVKKPNKTGIPDELKASVEQMSGLSLDDVKVHYNSKKPAELEALAYAEGTDIYVGPGQEEHLAHEVWHVVQQMGGKVKPTIQLKGEVPVNDDKGLEKEADVMGKKASQLNGKGAEETEETEEEEKKELSKGKKGGKTVQRLKWSEVHTGDVEEISLTESQLPEGVESTEETKDRNVFAGQKKDSSGFLWFEESTLEIQYDIKKMMQYKVMDPSTVFYTAVRDTEMDTIKQNGIDPNYKNEEQPEGSAEYDSKGFNYFGKDKTSEIYGGFIEKGTNWQVISFTLPKGTLIERDPKIPNGLRTTHHIKPGNIIASQSKHY